MSKNRMSAWLWWPVIVVFLVILIMTVTVSLAAPDALDATPSVAEVGQYLVVAFREGGSDAFFISSNELGADRSFLSGADPNTYSVFAERWHLAGANTNFDNQPPTEEPDAFQLANDGHYTPPGAARVFQGIDWSGNVALTSSTGTFEMQDIQVFADLGVQTANFNPVQSVSNSDYFPDTKLTANDGATPGNENSGDLDNPSAPGTTDGGNYNNDGLEGNVDLSQLLTDLGVWRTFIQGLTDPGAPAYCTITSDLVDQNAKDGAGPYEQNYDACDTDGDGVAVIDINRSGSDFNVNNSDWILEGSGDVLFIFRIRGNANMLMSNAAILLGDGGIGGGSATTSVDKIGAIFVKAHPDEEGTSSSDQVFNGDNVILNGIALWDLVEVGTGQASDTELIINNGQGCAQFISTKVNFQNVRWNRCTLGGDTLDWGDAPDPTYPTLSANVGANHRIKVGGPYMGNCVDAEGDGQPNVTASGDDSNLLGPSIFKQGICVARGDDEDGVSLPSALLLGDPAAPVTIDLSNSPAECLLNAWIDFDGSGAWDQPDEQIFTDLALTLVAHNLTFSVPPIAIPGTTYARFRCSTTPGLGPTGSAPDGEVEDYVVVISETPENLDYGDAPDPIYPTVFASNGARHVVTGPYLGACVDTENNGQPNATASGDDVNASTNTTGLCLNPGDDEDGVGFQTSLQVGQSATVVLTMDPASVSPTDCVVNGWIDFNGNGSWLDAGERIVANQPLVAGSGANPVAFPVPVGAVPGTTYARFRCSTLPDLPPDGLAPDGEVEDYEVEIVVDQEFDWGDLPDNYNTLNSSSGAVHVLSGGDPVLGVARDADGNGVPTGDAAGDDVTDANDDEDGVTPVSFWSDGNGEIEVTVSSLDACLNVWLDFTDGTNILASGDGDFNDIYTDADPPPNTYPEHVIKNLPMSPGPSQVLSFPLPPGAADGASWYMRARLTPRDPTGGCDPTSAYGGAASSSGQATGGEVEDYLVRFSPNAVSLLGLTAETATPWLLTLAGLLVLLGLVAAGAAWMWQRRRAM